MNLKNVICLGIAGNFANHLEQAGESSDFVNIQTTEDKAPKGIFPFYLPNSDTFLGLYSISTEKLNLPNYEANTQVEPEIGILFDIVYEDNTNNNSKQVTDIIAEKFTVFNDCTIRKDGAQKISEKKSWGENSKGISEKWIEIDKFDKGGIMDNYQICSFVKRDNILHEYGIDAQLVGYSYFHTKLKLWLVDKINNQKDFGPLEDISKHIKNCDYPKQVFVSIGATAYAEFGENNYLKKDDEIYIVAYDKNKDKPNFDETDSKIILKQKVF